jgi:hypothetical protein
MNTVKSLILLSLLGVAGFVGCNQSTEDVPRVPLTSDQLHQLREVRKEFTDAEISQWSGDKLLREMKQRK